MSLHVIRAVVRPRPRAAAQDHVAGLVARRLEDRRDALLGDRREPVRRLRRQHGIHRRLDPAVGPVLESHRHRQPRRQLAVDLALGRPRADRHPRRQVGDVLRDLRVEELRAGRQPEVVDVEQQLARQPQPLVDVIALVEIGIVDEPLPSDRGARLLEVASASRRSGDRRSAPPGRSAGPRSRAPRRSHGSSTGRPRRPAGGRRRRARRNRPAGVRHDVRRLLADRNLLQQDGGRDQRPDLSDTKIVCLAEHVPTDYQDAEGRDPLSPLGLWAFMGLPLSICLTAAVRSLCMLCTERQMLNPFQRLPRSRRQHRRPQAPGQAPGCRGAIFDYIDGGADGEVTLQREPAQLERRPVPATQRRTDPRLRHHHGAARRAAVDAAAPGAGGLQPDVPSPRRGGRRPRGQGRGHWLRPLHLRRVPRRRGRRRPPGPLWYQLYLAGGRERRRGRRSRAPGPPDAACWPSPSTPTPPGMRERDIRNRSTQLIGEGRLTSCRFVPHLLAPPALAGRLPRRPAGLMFYPNVVIPGNGPMRARDVARQPRHVDARLGRPAVDPRRAGPARSS